MMQAACEEIQHSDILVAELSDKAIGIGIEIGYASALNIPILYLRRQGTEYSKTAGGLANTQFVYHGPEDLKEKLRISISELFPSH